MNACFLQRSSIPASCTPPETPKLIGIDKGNEEKKLNCEIDQFQKKIKNLYIKIVPVLLILFSLHITLFSHKSAYIECAGGRRRAKVVRAGYIFALQDTIQDLQIVVPAVGRNDDGNSFDCL